MARRSFPKNLRHWIFNASTVFILLVFLSWGQASATFIDPCAILYKRIEDNRFTKDRRWHHYHRTFPGFTDRLLRPGQPVRWFDSGAGEGYAASDVLDPQKYAQYVDSTSGSNLEINLTEAQKRVVRGMIETPEANRPLVTILSYRIERNIEASPRLRSITGRFFEDIEDSELGRFDIITDVYGVFSYTPSVDRTLARYLGMLEPNGAIYLHFEAFVTSIKTSDGRELKILDWLRNIEGISVQNLERDSFLITRTSESMPRIPQLVLEKVINDFPPPRRIYRQLD
jgi:hypothetical protein